MEQAGGKEDLFDVFLDDLCLILYDSLRHRVIDVSKLDGGDDSHPADRGAGWGALTPPSPREGGGEAAGRRGGEAGVQG